MSIRRVKTKSGEIKWEVLLREGDRYSQRVRRRFERKSDAEAFYLDFKNQIRKRSSEGLYSGELKDRKFKDEAERWLRDGELRFSPGHLVRAKGVLREILDRFGNLTLDKMTPELLTAYQQEECASGLKNDTVNRKTETITSILNYAVKHRRIPFNPSTGFRKLSSAGREMLFWSKEEASSFLAFANEEYPENSQKRWVYVVYLLAINTAMRAGEIWGLKVMDISSDGRTLIVRRQFNRVSLEFAPTKGKNQRVVPCNRELLAELRKLAEINAIQREETIFMNDERKPICHENFVHRNFLGDLKKWGGRRIRFHDMRHTATTLLIASGVDIKTVMDICGHADIKTTMNYVHLVSGNVERVAMTFSISGKMEVDSLRSDL